MGDRVAGQPRGSAGRVLCHAAGHNIGAVAVTCGYGDRGELQSAGPERFVSSIVELMEYIRHADATSDPAGER